MYVDWLKIFLHVFCDSHQKESSKTTIYDLLLFIGQIQLISSSILVKLCADNSDNIEWTNCEPAFFWLTGSKLNSFFNCSRP